MTTCWFCGEFCNDKTKLLWCNKYKDICPCCFLNCSDKNYLWRKLNEKMYRECPLPKDYSPRKPRSASRNEDNIKDLPNSSLRHDGGSSI